MRVFIVPCVSLTLLHSHHVSLGANASFLSFLPVCRCFSISYGNRPEYWEISTVFLLVAKFSYLVVRDTRPLSVDRVWCHADYCFANKYSTKHKVAYHRLNISSRIKYHLLPSNIFGTLLDDDFLYGAEPSHSADANSRTVLDETC